MKLRTTILTSAFASLVVFASCSEDAHKKVPSSMEAGAAGEAGEPSQGGSGGVVASGGSGAGPDASGGAAGSAELAGAAGEAGASATPGALFLFTVDANSTGLAASGVAGATHPESTIFSSTTLNPDPITGTNEALVGAAELGLAAGDPIDAFAALQPTPSHAVYWFSVRAGEGGEGERPTRLARSSLDQEAVGDVYFSDATLSFRNLGEGGDRFGCNGLIADEQSLGLSPAAPATGMLDNLTGVQVLPGGALPKELYFSVGAGSVGVAGTAVAATADADRACTVFKSSLDGKNSVAFSCADLGLATGSNVTGLVVYGTSAPSEVLFAVASGSTGLTGTAVEAATAATTVTSDVFASPFDGTNTLRVAGGALGLAPSDQLDALTVVDHAPAAYAYSTSCKLTPDPLTPEGAGLTVFHSAHQLGSDLILVGGTAPPATTSIDGVGAYNVKTCAFVARSPIATNVLQGRTWAPVPLSGWSAAAPFSKLEYWSLSSDGTQIQRFDSSGTALGSYGLSGVAATTYTGFSLDYDPVHDHFFAVLDPYTLIGDYVRLSFARPAASTQTGTTLDVTLTPIPHPCAYSPRLSGFDAQGNSVYAQFDANTDFRVCTLSPTGELADLPFTWSLQTATPNYGMLVPGDAFYALFENSQFSVERYAAKP